MIILAVSGLGIILALLSFLWIWHSNAKEQEDLEDAISKMDDYDDYNY